MSEHHSGTAMPKEKKKKVLKFAEYVEESNGSTSNKLKAPEEPPRPASRIAPHNPTAEVPRSFDHPTYQYLALFGLALHPNSDLENRKLYRNVIRISIGYVEEIKLSGASSTKRNQGLEKSREDYIYILPDLGRDLKERTGPEFLRIERNLKQKLDQLLMYPDPLQMAKGFTDCFPNIGFYLEFMFRMAFSETHNKSRGNSDRSTVSNVETGHIQAGNKQKYPKRTTGETRRLIEIPNPVERPKLIPRRLPAATPEPDGKRTTDEREKRDVAPKDDHSHRFFFSDDWRPRDFYFIPGHAASLTVIHNIAQKQEEAKGKGNENKAAQHTPSHLSDEHRKRRSDLHRLALNTRDRHESLNQLYTEHKKKWNKLYGFAVANKVTWFEYVKCRYTLQQNEELVESLTAMEEDGDLLLLEQELLKDLKRRTSGREAELDTIKKQMNTLDMTDHYVGKDELEMEMTDHINQFDLVSKEVRMYKTPKAELDTVEIPHADFIVNEGISRMQESLQAIRKDANLIHDRLFDPQQWKLKQVSTETGAQRSATPLGRSSAEAIQGLGNHSAMLQSTGKQAVLTYRPQPESAQPVSTLRRETHPQRKDAPPAKGPPNRATTLAQPQPQPRRRAKIHQLGPFGSSAAPSNAGNEAEQSGQ